MLSVLHIWQFEVTYSFGGKAKQSSAWLMADTSDKPDVGCLLLQQDNADQDRIKEHNAGVQCMDAGRPTQNCKLGTHVIQLAHLNCE